MDDNFGDGPSCQISFPNKRSWQLLKLNWSLGRAKRKANGQNVTETIPLYRFLGNMEEGGVSGAVPVSDGHYQYLWPKFAEFLSKHGFTLKDLQLKSAGVQEKNLNFHEVLNATVTV
jgi:hypothetical protein